jgi:hypothetical protein
MNEDLINSFFHYLLSPCPSKGIWTLDLRLMSPLACTAYCYDHKYMTLAIVNLDLSLAIYFIYNESASWVFQRSKLNVSDKITGNRETLWYDKDKMNEDFIHIFSSYSLSRSQRWDLNHRICGLWVQWPELHLLCL